MTRIQELLADDPWWLVIGKAVALFALATVLTLFNIWFERRVVARMQNRVGPNRHGPFGLMQSLADGVKLALKEDVIPKAADTVVFVLAPIISTVAAFMTFAVIPFGPEVSVFGETTALQLWDPGVGVLYVLAIASVGVYGLVLAGWSSGSTYPLLGGLRSTAQVISYEVAMGLSFVAVFLYAGSMATSEIVQAQAGQLWFAILLFPSFLIYLVSMVGETNRAPFDLPEAEGELVAGFHTEYSSLKFALFFLAEYINMVTVSALATTMFLGGWRAPWPISAVWEGANEGWVPLIWFFGKVLLVIFLFIWLRGTLPRMRYDQFMRLGWKVLIPASLVWIVLVATTRALSQEYDFTPRDVLLYGGIAFVVLMAVLWFFGGEEEPAEDDRRAEGETPAEFDPMAGGYPVPPMPGQLLPAGRPGRPTEPVGARTSGAGASGARPTDDPSLREDSGA